MPESTGEWVSWLPAVAVTLFYLWLWLVVDPREQRRACNDQEAWDQWWDLTDDDREWFAAHDYAGPPDPDKQWSSGWL